MLLANRSQGSGATAPNAFWGWCDVRLQISMLESEYFFSARLDLVRKQDSYRLQEEM
jgi:hypothetical protein